MTKALKACVDIMQDRQLCVARELTKKFEDLSAAAAPANCFTITNASAQSEIVLVVSGV